MHELVLANEHPRELGLTWYQRAAAKVSGWLMPSAVKALYDAGRRSKRTRGWRTNNNSINAETRRSLPLLRERSRELHQNHWAAARAKSIIQRNVIGGGIVPTSRDGGDNIYLHDLMRSCDLDPAGRKTMGAIQALALGGVVESGECLIIRRWRTPGEMRSRGLMSPVQFEVLESDHLDHTVDGPLDDGRFVLQGVEYSRQGWPIAYHIRTSHPGDLMRFSQWESVRVPASEVCHPFIELRPGQARGIPWGAPVLLKMRDLADYEDAQLQRQKIANAWAVFVHHTDDVRVEELYDPKGVPQSVIPGMVEYLRPGESVEFANPPSAEGFRDFSEITAQHIAAAYELSYPSLTGDYGRMNFSAGRMAHVEMQRSITVWQEHLMVAQVCRFFERSIRIAMSLQGYDPGQSSWKWTPPRREMIDPVKETAATVAAVRAGLNTMPDAITQNGRDVEDVIEELVAWNTLLDQHNLTLTSDPRKTTDGGQAMPALTEEQ